jgi:hypothetical protein
VEARAAPARADAKKPPAPRGPARLGGQAGRRGPSAHHGGEDEAARLANPTTSPPPPRSSRPCSRRPQCASTNSSALARTPIHTNAIASQSFMASAYAMEADANLNAIPLTNGGQHRQAAARNFSTPASPRHFKNPAAARRRRTRWRTRPPWHRADRDDPELVFRLNVHRGALFPCGPTRLRSRRRPSAARR